MQNKGVGPHGRYKSTVGGSQEGLLALKKVLWEGKGEGKQKWGTVKGESAIPELTGK